MYARGVRALLLTLVFSSTALADIPPEPQRPEWEHTPLPMPDVPSALAMLLVVMAVGAAFWWLHRRDQEA